MADNSAFEEKVRDKIRILEGWWGQSKIEKRTKDRLKLQWLNDERMLYQQRKQTEAENLMEDYTAMERAFQDKITEEEEKKLLSDLDDAEEELMKQGGGKYPRKSSKNRRMNNKRKSSKKTRRKTRRKTRLRRTMRRKSKRKS